MPEDILIREATLTDIETVAAHRAAMFLDMGRATPDITGRLIVETRKYLREAIPSGEYVGWLAGPKDEPGRIVSGAGVQVRRVLPFPWSGTDRATHVAWGSQAVVINVYTEPEFRRRGYARCLMQQVIAWARAVELESLVLHAAPAGRALYEQLGFVPTTEMRLTGDRLAPSAVHPT